MPLLFSKPIIRISGTSDSISLFLNSESMPLEMCRSDDKLIENVNSCISQDFNRLNFAGPKPDDILKQLTANNENSEKFKSRYLQGDMSGDLYTGQLRTFYTTAKTHTGIVSDKDYEQSQNLQDEQNYKSLIDNEGYEKYKAVAFFKNPYNKDFIFVVTEDCFDVNRKVTIFISSNHEYLYYLKKNKKLKNLDKNNAQVKLSYMNYTEAQQYLFGKLPSQQLRNLAVLPKEYLMLNTFLRITVIILLTLSVVGIGILLHEKYHPGRFGLFTPKDTLTPPVSHRQVSLSGSSLAG